MVDPLLSVFRVYFSVKRCQTKCPDQTKDGNVFFSQTMNQCLFLFNNKAQLLCVFFELFLLADC